MKTLFIALRAAIFGAGFIFLWGWVALGLHRRYDTPLGFAPPGWTRPLGIAVMLAGGILALACMVTFVTRGQGTPAPIDPPRKFVAIGPYKFVRNLMYIGGFIVLSGFGLYEQSPAILLFALPWLLFAHLFVILYEEPHLRATFGAPYGTYCRSVRRWLPRLRPALTTPKLSSRRHPARMAGKWLPLDPLGRLGWAILSAFCARLSYPGRFYRTERVGLL